TPAVAAAITLSGRGCRQFTVSRICRLSDVVSAREELSLQLALRPKAEFPFVSRHEAVSVSDPGSLDGIHDADLPGIEVGVVSGVVRRTPVESFCELRSRYSKGDSPRLMVRDERS